MKRFLLNSAKNNTNVNVESGDYISLSTKQRNLPLEKNEVTINHYELYLKERNECKTYKMYFTLHPYMTNILPNAFTEIVYNEGAISSGIITPEGSLYAGHAKLFRTDIHNKRTKNALFSYDDMIDDIADNSGDTLIDRRYQLLRDTEYSHKSLGNLTYHCGLDIFNNHYLRSNGFFRICKSNDRINNENVFNTIEDLLIYSDGKVATHVRETPGDDKTTSYVDKESHLFTHENLLSTYDAFINGIKENNGWVGFYNKSYLPEVNFSNNITINRCLNNKETCAFIDLYPDRTLFSFLPKINDGFGSREEYNWKWCLTYPFASTIKDENGGNFDFFDENGLKIIWCTSSELYESQNESNVLLANGFYCVIRDKRSVYFRTKCKHNLNPNDIIRFKNGSYDFSVKVLNVGDENRKNEKYYFSVSYDDLADGLSENKKTLTSNDKSVFYIKIPNDLSVSKIVEGIPCKYYVRKFKKLKDFHYTMNGMAFSNTIFNDKISQILYDEDIDVSGLKDNLGREVTEIFLTLIKNNKGWENYYLSGITSPLSVEYSHCFGKITSGFNFECEKNESFKINPTLSFSTDSYFQKYNVRSLYNLENFNFSNENDLRVFCNKMGIYFAPPKCVENNITIDDNIFYGDFIEFSPSTVTETVVEDIYHRFNTAQRETMLNNDYFKFKRFKYDELIYDDFDFNITANSSGVLPDAVSSTNGLQGFSVEINHKGFRKKLMDNTEVSEEIKNKICDNIFPEGYFYKPHYRVKLKEYSNVLKSDVDTIMVKDSQINIRKDGFLGRYSFPITKSYGFSDGDKMVFYYSDGHKNEYYIYPTTENNRIAFYDYTHTFDEIRENLKIIFYKNRNIPDYAYYTGDGSGKHVWREIIKDTELPQDSDIYNRMYANGSVYVNTNINFYLRRQDPYGVYGLQYTNPSAEGASNFIIDGVEVHKGDIDYITEENNSICEI